MSYNGIEDAFAGLPDSAAPEEPQADNPIQEVFRLLDEDAKVVRVEFVGCSQSFPDQDAEGGALEVIEDISFVAEGNETIAILGPSGCGKSTVLRMVSGMHPRGIPMPTTGECRINGEVVEGPHDDVLTVFQTPVLAGWHTVLGNVMLAFRPFLFGPRMRWPHEWAKDMAVSILDRFEVTRGKVKNSKPWQEIRERSEAIIEAVGLTDVMHQFPHQLSGGQRQRAALATTLVVNPKIMCMDEPFSALDPATRIECQELLAKLKLEYPCLTFFVTHDVTEAIAVADRIIVLSTRPAKVVGSFRVSEGMDPHGVKGEALKTRIHHLLAEVAGRTGGHGTLTYTV